MQGNRLLPISQAQAWEALNDPTMLKLCIPGCDKVETTGENQFSVGMKLAIGPVSAKFSGKVQLSDLKPPESYTLSFDGQGGVAGHGKGKAQVTLVPAAGGGCDLQYSVDSQVGGKIAQLGQRLIDGAAKSMADDFFKRFDTEARVRYNVVDTPVENTEVKNAVVADGKDNAAIETVVNSKHKIPPFVWVIGAMALVLIAIGLFNVNWG